MSIAEQESAERYPDEYWPGFEPREGYAGRLAYLDGLTTDDLREAYEQGRTAPVTEVEIDAVAALDCADATNGCCEFDGESDSDKLLWRNHARKLLEAARKAVSDE